MVLISPFTFVMHVSKIVSKTSIDVNGSYPNDLLSAFGTCSLDLSSFQPLKCCTHKVILRVFPVRLQERKCW